MRALVTGGSGFVGQWLIRALLARGDAVDATGLGDRLAGPPILTAAERAQVRWMPADIRDGEDVELVVERSLPDVTIHLAGVSFPPDADRSPTTTFEVNTLGAIRLLAALRRRKAAGVADPTVLVIGSGTQYGQHPAASMPLDEEAVQRPVTVYAASKAAQEIAALQLQRASAGALRVICTRSFNHSGVGHGDQYLLPSLVRRALRMRQPGSRAGPLAVGNDVVRDYLHVDDVVDAYLRLVEHGRAGEVYNVASGKGISARALAEDVLLHAGVTADISTDPTLIRATDIPVLVGSPAKLSRETGWSPRKTHADIIDDLLRHAFPVPTTHAATD